MVMPKICSEGGPEDARRIHGCAGKWSAEQDVERDCRSNRETGDAPSAFIDRGAVDDKDEKEGEDCFHQNSLGRVQINGELRCAHHDDIASKQAETNQSGAETAEQLRAPVTN